MLEEVLRYINNWFRLPGGVYVGSYTVADGSIELPFLQTGQYFRIVASTFNDGLYQYPASDLHDETFWGSVWALAIPQAVIDIAGEIEAWQAKNGETLAGPYNSESFGGYQYTKATDSLTGSTITWQSAFRSRLSKWRKI